MYKKLLANAGIASLLLMGVPSIATAATDTITDMPSPSPMTADGASIYRDFVIPSTGTVSKVTVAVDFATHNGVDCALTSGPGMPYPGELEISLIAPSTTQVILVSAWDQLNGATYLDGLAPGARAQVTFDDDALERVGSGAPVSGVFQGMQSLAAFQGESAAGTWQLLFRDTSKGEAKCYYSAALTVETVDPATPTDPIVSVDPAQIAPTPAIQVETASR